MILQDISPLEFPTSKWRLIKSHPAKGAWNMAVDEAILQSVGQGIFPPTLRLYSWNPPCLSLGYAQPISDVDIPSIKSLGWDLVRRPTGGRAILHTDELTYSVIAPHTEPRLAGGVLESYKRISQALLFALRILNIPAEALPLPNNFEPNTKETKPVCFEVPSKYEITINGKKLIGSAQARKKTGILQHGTLPLYGDLIRITHVLSFNDERDRLNAEKRLLSHACTVETFLGKRITWGTAAQAFIQAFSQILKLDLIPSELSNEETEMATKLMQSKYSNSEWTSRL